MAETYSLAIGGVQSGTPFTINTTIVGDSSARVGGQALAMQNGTQILCKNPDGSKSYYTIDAERSIPGGTPVLRRV